MSNANPPAAAGLSHEEASARSRRNLEHARARAAKEHKYNSRDCRQRMAAAFSASTRGKKAYEWQLDAAECIMLGLNGVFIARTGAGKTVPFALPFFLSQNQDKVAVVISPLKALQREHARRFRKMGIPAKAVNGETWSPELAKEILAGKYRVLFAGPEMLLADAACRKTIMQLGTKIMAFVVDEAHCISQWGGDFRPKYSELSQLRSFVPPSVPIVAFSATVTPATLNDIENNLKLDLPSGFYFNMGNDRSNVKLVVHEMKSADDYAALLQILKLNELTVPSDIPKTLVFANNRSDVEYIWRFLSRRLPSDMRSYVAFYHSLISPRTKKYLMKRFAEGKIRILVATEAVGMGADIPDIEVVIQFGAPLSLNIWVQRAGRAGRNLAIQAVAYVLVEKSVFQVQKRKSSSKNSGKDPPKLKTKIAARQAQKKNIDDSLRQFLEVPTSGCRRRFLDEYFNNPPRARECYSHCVKYYVHTNDSNVFNHQ
ncbi:P-loop containing nucleoside triphosphate hydrolase protein [Panus rudis PR-1116 ss-1]|nr:P-loop containing nucleoside triphosphate hydrolase protein [Panus rudis PR-1116 ss-1]